VGGCSRFLSAAILLFGAHRIQVPEKKKDIEGSWSRPTRCRPFHKPPPSSAARRRLASMLVARHHRVESIPPWRARLDRDEPARHARVVPIGLTGRKTSPRNGSARSWRWLMARRLDGRWRQPLRAVFTSTGRDLSSSPQTASALLLSRGPHSTPRGLAQVHRIGSERPLLAGSPRPLRTAFLPGGSGLELVSPIRGLFSGGASLAFSPRCSSASRRGSCACRVGILLAPRRLPFVSFLIAATFAT